MTQNPTTDQPLTAEEEAALRPQFASIPESDLDADERIIRGLFASLDEARATAPAGLREAAREVIAAFDARPDTDERDHPEGLTKEQVELAWSLWDIRQMNALDALRAALAASGETER